MVRVGPRIRNSYRRRRKNLQNVLQLLVCLDRPLTVVQVLRRGTDTGSEERASGTIAVEEVEDS